MTSSAFRSGSDCRRGARPVLLCRANAVPRTPRETRVPLFQPVKTPWGRVAEVLDEQQVNNGPTPSPGSWRHLQMRSTISPSGYCFQPCQD